MPHRFSSVAMARSVTCPRSRMPVITGASPSANSSALTLTARLSATAPLPARRSASAPLGVAELDTAGPDHGQGLLDPARDLFAFGLDDDRKAASFGSFCFQPNSDNLPR